ncbi:SusC/RagA family TonB-linked outer membrane protein [Bacteroidia bacterium]|nr:SusC/RagA family TonB-linked outer membrane protein [Bacteroidia bacterium]
MKLTSLFLLLGMSMIWATNADSQTARVNIQATNVQAKEIINQIEEQTDYLFVYNYDKVDLSRKLTLHASNTSVAEVLAKMFEHSDVIYAMEGNNILLMKRNESLEKLQNAKRITGTVTDAHGEAIIGANVVEKGTSNGVITDIDGKFSLQISTNVTLVVSYIGYNTQEVAVGNQTNLKITLLESTLGLNEVVVVGYGTQKKGEVASSIISVKAEDFIKVPSPDAAQMIRGQVAGLAIISPDANPTSTSQISLRGITTLKSSASPLVLIDGIPGDLITVSPDDIEQIDVLKDGSAAAIYGTRGTNGVIIITTKNAKGEMPTTVDVNAYLSTQQITRKLPFMTIDQYLDKVKQGKPGAQDNGGRVNWLDEVLQTPLTQVYNVSLRGGSRTTNYTASFEYRGLNGLIKRSNNQMIYPRVEVTHRMFENKLRINANLSGYQQSYFSGSDGGSYNSGVYRNALTFNPTDPIKDANGVWSESPSKTDYFNPLALLYEVEGQNQATNLRMNASVNFTPIEGLDIKYLISSNTYNQVRGYYETQKHISTVRENKNGFASRGTTRSINDLSEFTVQYKKTLATDHTFTILGGYSYMNTNYQNYWMQNWDFPSDDYTYNSMQSGQALRDGRANENSEQRENKLIGYFGRLNYSFQGKYIVAASVRYEGSSKFGADHKWGTFPAASIAWNIKGEGFLADVQTLSSLKLRAGYGVTGTEPSDPYMSLNTLSFGDYAYINGAWIKSIRPNSNPNPDLRWEKKEEINIGIDFGFFDERLTGSIDWYNRETNDLLWDYTVPSPPYLFSSMIANAGSMRNTGVEVSLRAIPVQTKDFQWATNANYSTNKNELLSLSNDQFISSGYSDQGGTGEPMQQSTHRIQEGQPIGNFYGFKSIDIDDTGHWIIEGEDGNPKPISQQQPTDKKILGNGLPKHYLNWNNSISYKNFDLGVTMRGAFGFQILNMPELQYGAPVMLSRGNIMQKAYENVYGKRPLADDQELQYVSYYLEDGDYWKIDNLTLGYTLNLHNKWIERFRIYGTISNLAVITGYGGIDPEISISGLAPGRDDKNRFPAARTFTLGASFKF